MGMPRKFTVTLNINPDATRYLSNRDFDPYMDQGTVGYSMASFKCYVLHAATTKLSPSHITAKNGRLLITVQTLAERGSTKNYT